MSVSSLFGCPLPSGLPTIADQPCTIENGPIIAFAFQQVQASPSFTGTGEGDIKAQASWTPLIAASNATAIRIVQVTNATITAGEAVTSGGNDASTYKGVPKVLHGGFAQVTATLEGYSPVTAKAVRDIIKFSRTIGGRTVLRVFILHQNGAIGHLADFNGLEVYAMFVSDLNKTTNYREEDNYTLSFAMPYGWSDVLVYSKAAFDLGLLKNPS